MGFSQTKNGVTIETIDIENKTNNTIKDLTTCFGYYANRLSST